MRAIVLSLSFVRGDFVEMPSAWKDTTFILMHASCFDVRMMRAISSSVDICQDGCYIVTITKKLDLKLAKEYKLIYESIGREVEEPFLCAQGPVSLFIYKRRNRLTGSHN